MNRETSNCIVCKAIIPFGLLYCINCRCLIYGLPEPDNDSDIPTESMLEELGYEL